MMNKSKGVFNGEKRSILKYEMTKIKSNWLKIFIITVMIQLMSFIFFSIVGKLDNSSDTISSFQGIIALSNTVAMCGISIYIAILLRKELVRFYIGEQRNRVFLFPVDRKELILKKTSSFFIVVLSSFLSALTISIIIEMIINLFFKLDTINIFISMYLGFITIVTSCILLFIILILSEIISIWRQSEISTIITAVVTMLIFSNFSAMGLIKFPTLIFLSSVAMGTMCIWLFIIYSKTLYEMEVY